MLVGRSILIYFILSLFSFNNFFLYAYSRDDVTVHLAHMFENSTRRDLTSEELQPLIYFKSGCTGFFLQNTHNKAFIMTARHCYKLDFTNKCNNGEVQFFARQNNQWVEGTCEKVIAASIKDDAVIFEARFQASFTLPLNTYSLAGTEPPACTNVQLMGFPGDSERNRRPTASENCWTQPYFSPHVRKFKLDPKTKSATIADNESYWSHHNEMLKKWSQLDITPGYYNCSVYGGNSGGPLQIAGQQIAIGLPHQYLSTPGVIFPSRYHSVYESLAAFTKSHRNTLKQHEIHIANRYTVTQSRQCIDL